MGRRLARVVIVRNERHEAVAFGPGDDVPEWAAEQITNPEAWEGGSLPILDQLVRIGATADEVSAITDAWMSLPEDERWELKGDDVSDDEAREQLAQMRAEAAEHGLTFAEQIRQAMTADAAESTTPDEAAGDGDGEPAGSPPAGELATPVERPARNGSKAAWLAYAIGQGMPEEDAQRRTRDELADFYGD